MVIYGHGCLTATSLLSGTSIHVVARTGKSEIVLEHFFGVTG
jgi:hypothetical protein